MKRKGCAWLMIGAVSAAVLAHVLLSALPNRDDAAADAIRGAGGKARRTPRLEWLAVRTDAYDAFYPRGDVWSAYLRDAEVGPDVADGLSTLRSVEHLDLVRCRLRPDVTANLVPPSASLGSLYVSDTDLRDCHIGRLGDCPNLSSLTLDGTQATDASVPVIARCRSLRSIILRGNKITGAGFAAVRAAFPRASVVTEEVGGGGRPPDGPPR